MKPGNYPSVKRLVLMYCRDRERLIPHMHIWINKKAKTEKEMKVIIAGSRTFVDYERVKKELDVFNSKVFITEVVSGAARGADLMGERWAKERGIPIKKYPADWNTLGKYAGIARNNEMAAYADALAAFWDGESKGTLNMIYVMTRLEKKITIIRIDK